MGITHKAKVNVFRTDLHSFYQQKEEIKSPEHLYWLSGPERFCVCDEVRYLKLAKASVAVCLWLEMNEGIGFKPLLLFPPSLPPSNEL